MSDTKPMEGTWKLIAPDLREWYGDSPLECVRKEVRERIPAEVALKRIMNFVDEPTKEEIRMSTEIASALKCIEDITQQMVDALSMERIGLHNELTAARQFITALIAERDTLRAELAEAQQDAERLSWAESHPEIVYRQISSDWARAGRGFREEGFNFRGSIDAAMNRSNEE